MHSKILNLNYTDNKVYQNRIQPQYMNFIGVSTISPLAKILKEDGTFGSILTTELTNFPLSNIKDSYSITKEGKTSVYTASTEWPSFTQYFSGITLNLTTPSYETTTFSNICIMLNKLNKTYINKLKASNINFAVCFRHKTTESLSRIIYFELNQQSGLVNAVSPAGTTIFSSNYYFTDLDSGIIMLDETLLYNVLGSENISYNTYYIDIYTVSPSTSMTNFAVANIFVGNSINFYADENLEFVNENLNKYSINTRTGKTFTELNSSLKSLTLDFTNLYSSELLSDLNNWIEYNKDAPMIVLPFNNYNNNYTYDSESLKWQKLNFKLGSLYYIADDIKIKNTTYDVFDHAIKFKEFK